MTNIYLLILAFLALFRFMNKKLKIRVTKYITYLVKMNNFLEKNPKIMFS